MYVVRRGDTMEGSRGRARVRFLKTAGIRTASCCDSSASRASWRSPGRGYTARPSRQTERIEVVSGMLSVRVRGRGRRRLGAGGVVEVSPGAPHGFRNRSDAEAHVLVEFRPALDTESAFETLFGLAGPSCSTNSTGASWQDCCHRFRSGTGKGCLTLSLPKTR